MSQLTAVAYTTVFKLDEIAYMTIIADYVVFAKVGKRTHSGVFTYEAVNKLTAFYFRSLVYYAVLYAVASFNTGVIFYYRFADDIVVRPYNDVCAYRNFAAYKRGRGVLELNASVHVIGENSAF